MRGHGKGEYGAGFSALDGLELSFLQFLLEGWHMAGNEFPNMPESVYVLPVQVDQGQVIMFAISRREKGLHFHFDKANCISVPE